MAHRTSTTKKAQEPARLFTLPVPPQALKLCQKLWAEQGMVHGGERLKRVRRRTGNEG